MTAYSKILKACYEVWGRETFLIPPKNGFIIQRDINLIDILKLLGDRISVMGNFSGLFCLTEWDEAKQCFINKKDIIWSTIIKDGLFFQDDATKDFIASFLPCE